MTLTVHCPKCGGERLNAQGACIECLTPVWPYKPEEDPPPNQDRV